MQFVTSSRFDWTYPAGINSPRSSVANNAARQLSLSRMYENGLNIEVGGIISLRILFTITWSDGCQSLIGFILDQSCSSRTRKFFLRGHVDYRA